MIRFYVRVPADPHFECDGYDTIEDANAAARQAQHALRLKAFVEASEQDDPPSALFAGVVPSLGAAP